CCSSDHISLRCRPTQPQKRPHKFPPKLLTPGRLRWLLSQERFAQKLRNNILKYPTLGGDASIAIVRLAKQSLGHCVDHHVAGPCIESNESLGTGARRNCRQVRNPTNVLHDAPDVCVAIKQ